MSGGLLFALDAVSFAVPERTLLQPLSLTLAPGRVIGLIGHNGSGKSTLLKLLARQLAPSCGRVQFEGRSLAAWPARELARRIAYLPQQVAAADGMLVRELVALGRYPWHGALGRFGAEDRGLVATAMDLTGVTDFSGRLVDTLSGGERQRAWLAMLMAQDARTLLLDEPISALDVRHQVAVMALIQRLSHDRGLSIVVVLHDVNIAACFCDEIVALHSGQVIAQGPPTVIVTPDRLRRIYGLRLGVMPHPVTGLPLSYLP